MLSDEFKNLKNVVPIKIINDKSLQGPIFHPGDPSDLAWTAANNSASQYQGILSVWKNMVGYFNKSRNEHGYDQKLQIKSGICELKTLIDILPKMHSTIISHPIYNKSGLKPYISISQRELDETGRLYKNLNIEKNKTIKRIQKIRNNIGSHFSDAQINFKKEITKSDKRSSREKISWDEVTLLWQSLEVTSFIDLILAIKDYIDSINNLPIYEWYRSEKNGSIRTHVPRTGIMNSTGEEIILVMSENMEAILSKIKGGSS